MFRNLSFLDIAAAGTLLSTGVLLYGLLALCFTAGSHGAAALLCGFSGLLVWAAAVGVSR